MAALSECIGQAGTATLLRRLLLAGRLPHALLIEGIPGCGRRTLARALSRALLCRTPHAGDACGTCASCTLVDSRTHPDLVETPHDGEDAVPTLGVDELREQVVARVMESPLIGERRVFLLYGAERFNQSCANALLKVLEEPPPGAYLILTTATAGGVLATIRSRTQLLRLHPLGEAELVAILTAGGVPEAVARARAMRGSGSHRGLWSDLEAVPLEELRDLALDGFSSERIAQVVAALPQELSAEQEALGLTVPQAQRAAVKQWLRALAQSLRVELHQRSDPAIALRIERILLLLRDLDRNIQPRLVIEALAVESDPRRSARPAAFGAIGGS